MLGNFICSEVVLKIELTRLINGFMIASGSKVFQNIRILSNRIIKLRYFLFMLTILKYELNADNKKKNSDISRSLSSNSTIRM